MARSLDVRWVVAAATACGFVFAGGAGAATIAVPADHATIQAALDAAGPGDDVLVSPGSYNEKISFPSSGTSGNPITLQSTGGAAVTTITGAGRPGDNIVLIDTKSHVRVVGFTIRDNTGVTDGSGIRVLGSGTGIELRDNVIREIRGTNAMGITVYATEAAPVENLVIDGNEILDCDPSPSEALTLNGNVRAFEVTDNHVHDVNNIAIDFIGGETDIQPNPSLVAREGVCRGNIVERCGSGFSGGIYVDGGRDILIENNTVTECDLGIEVAAENAGILTSGVEVRNNVLYHNRVVGLIFGGFAAGVGRANENVFRGNTLYKNATDAGDGVGEIWVQYGNDNVLENNLVWARGAADGGVPNQLVASFNATNGNTFDHNLYYTADGDGAASFGLDDVSYTGLAEWQSSGQDAGGLFAAPQLVDPDGGDFHLGSSSPAVDAGDPAYLADLGEVDLDGSTRVAGGRVDIGADEVTCGDGVTDPGEQCDDNDLDDGDGCDSNCTVTGCGNGVVTMGEQCDDGNFSVGDCCDASCSFETAGSSCDDDEPCTLADACDGAGTCSGDAEPDPACVEPTVAGGAAIKLREGGASDFLLWRWGKGPEVASFGDPSTGDDYVLCIYESDGPTTILDALMPSGTRWSALASGSFKYRSRDGSPGGVTTSVMKTGAAGKAKIKLKGKGAALGLAPLAIDGAATVSVQLRSDTAGTCFGATFAPPFDTNDAGAFADKSE